MQKDTDSSLKVVPLSRDLSKEKKEEFKAEVLRLIEEDAAMCCVAASADHGAVLLTNIGDSASSALFSFGARVSQDMFLSEITGCEH